MVYPFPGPEINLGDRPAHVLRDAGLLIPGQSANLRHMKRGGAALFDGKDLRMQDDGSGTLTLAILPPVEEVTAEIPVARTVDGLFSRCA